MDWSIRNQGIVPQFKRKAYRFRTERPGQTGGKGRSTIFPPMTIHINTCLIHYKMTRTVESYIC